MRILHLYLHIYLRIYIHTNFTFIFPSLVLNTASSLSLLARGKAVGMGNTLRPYTSKNSSASVKAVPVMPLSFGNNRKRFWYVTLATRPMPCIYISSLIKIIVVCIYLYLYTYDVPMTWVSEDTCIPSFASMACCIPSVNLLPSITLPVKLSTMNISLSFIMYSLSLANSSLALRALTMKNAHGSVKSNKDLPTI